MKILKSMFQFAVGAALVLLAGWLAFRFWPRPELPEGWQSIRPPLDVMALAEYKGDIWAGGRDGLVRIDRNSGVVLEEVQADVPLDYVTALLVDPAGEHLLVGHENGLSRLEDGRWTTISSVDGLPSDKVLVIARDDQGGLWVGTDAGLVHMHRGTSRVYTTADGMASDTVSTLFLDHRGWVWAGGGIFYAEGLSMYDGSSWRVFTVDEGLAHPMVNSILEEAPGVLWFGAGFSSFGGLTCYDGERWQSIDRDDGLAGWKVRLLFQDNLSTMWVSSEYNGIAFSSGETWKILTPKDGLVGWEVKAMLQDSQSDLWLGTENGLSRLSQETWIELVSQ